MKSKFKIISFIITISFIFQTMFVCASSNSAELQISVQNKMIIFNQKDVNKSLFAKLNGASNTYDNYRIFFKVYIDTENSKRNAIYFQASEKNYGLIVPAVLSIDLCPYFKKSIFDVDTVYNFEAYIVDNDNKLIASSNEGSFMLKSYTPTPTVSPTPTPTPTTTTTPSDDPKGGFVDIDGHWAEEDIIYLASLDVVNGYGDATFRPDNNITREEMAVMLAKAIKLEGNPNETTFTDKSTIHDWARNYINSLAEKRIVFGYPDGTFKASQNLTREEMAAMLLRAYNISEIFDYTRIQSDFQDFSSIGDWSKSYVAKAYEMCITLGYQNNFGNTFAPQKAVTRAEAATMLARMIRMQNPTQ